MNDNSDQHEAITPRHRFWPKLVLLGVLVGIIAIVYVQFGDILSLQNLANQESQLRRLQGDHVVAVFAVAFLIYVAVTGLSLPGATGMTLIYGWYFGFAPAAVLVSFASTAGATLAFLLSRYLFRDSLQRRFSDRLAGFNAALEREGAFYLFTLRLMPAIPFFVINAVMGLTPIRTRTFWWVSQLGMLPGTLVYVYAGSSVPSLQKLADEKVYAVFSPQQLTQIVIALVLLGFFPWIVRNAMKRMTRISSEH